MVAGAVGALFGKVFQLCSALVPPPSPPGLILCAPPSALGIRMLLQLARTQTTLEYKNPLYQNINVNED